ncbi:MAG: platelet-activating factor acetylhydrolase IB subunit [Fimbriimonadaceae bacterium]|nr:acetylglucosamine-6-sulfatase [Chthonomonadaceae bacterium]MCO5297356.1 platelet-activating factor acetylhydrolase IB subunit [Fimbriimonadaceae bacterium]
MIALVLATLAMQIPQHVATTPAERLGEGWWKDRHEQCVKITQAGGVDLVFLGDSITHSFEGPGKAVWDREYAPLKAANFGFSGDRTEHVLWRLRHGEIVGLQPKAIVIMIGTNNIGHGSSNPTQTADGVKAIVAELLEKVPSAKILLLGIFPRGANADDPMRTKVAEATALFKGIADGKRVHFLDIGYAFIRIDGSLRTLLMPDALHPNAAGYEIWAKAMAPALKKVMG